MPEKCLSVLIQYNKYRRHETTATERDLKTYMRILALYHLLIIPTDHSYQLKLFGGKHF